MIPSQLLANGTRPPLLANGTRVRPAAVAPYLAAAPIRGAAPRRSLPFVRGIRPSPRAADLAVIRGDGPNCRVAP